MGVYDYEGNVEPGWEDGSNLVCHLCATRIRMPGHPICSYCDTLGLRFYAEQGIRSFEALLVKNVPWSEYQVEHGLL